MKTKKLKIILFFLILCMGINSYSQRVKDSVSYFVKIVSNSKDADSLTVAYEFFYRYKESNLKGGNKAKQVFGLDKISRIEFALGLYYNSEKSCVEGLQVLDEIPEYEYNQWYRSIFLNRTGAIRRNLNDYEGSLDSYLKALKLTSSRKDSATAYNNIGVQYKYQERYKLAKVNFERSLELHTQVKDNEANIARSLDNLGFVQGTLNEEDEEGIANMLKALEIRKVINIDIYTSYKHLTEFYTQRNDKIKALFYGRKALSFAKQNKIESYQLDAMNNLLDLDEFIVIQDFRRLNAKVELEKQLNENKFEKAKYDVSKWETRTAQAEAKAAKSDKESQRNLFIALGVGLISIFLFFVIRTRHKKKILIKQFETEQYISKKLHDEVANDVFHTITKVRGNQTDQPQLLNTLDEIYHKVRDISKSNADLDVIKDFGRLLNDLISSYKIEQVQIFTKGASKIVWNEISEVKRKMLYRILQELMINMKKHSQASLVTLNFEKDSGKLKVRYVDNGVGCSLEKGSGLTNTESRMEMIGGTITFESEIGKGFRANLTL